MTSPSFRAMHRFILEHPGSTSREVSDALGADRSRISSYLYRMHLCGYLVRDSGQYPYRWTAVEDNVPCTPHPKDGSHRMMVLEKIGPTEDVPRRVLCQRLPELTTRTVASSLEKLKRQGLVRYHRNRHTWSRT